MNYEKFTTMAQEALQEASELAIKYDAPQVTGMHLLEALHQQNNSSIKLILQSVIDAGDTGTDRFHYGAFPEALRDYLKQQPKIQGSTQLVISQTLQQTLVKSQIVAEDLKDTHVSCEHLLLALIKYDAPTSQFLRDYKVTYEAVLAKVKSIRAGEKIVLNDEQHRNNIIKEISEFATDITAQAAAGKMDPIIGREDEIRRMMQILSRRMKNNPVLVGDPGVGKTALVEGLAQRIVKGDVPDTLKDKRIFELRIGELMAGTEHRGSFEKKLQKIIQIIEDSNGQIILFIDEIHTIVGAGKAEGASDMGNMIKPALARGRMRVIGATTLGEYRKHIEKDPALERRFQPVMVDEPARDDAISILRGIKGNYETHHGVKITDAAVVAAVDLSIKYISDRFLPDKAIDLMDEATAAVKMAIVSQPEEVIELERKVRNMEVELQALHIERKDTNLEATQKKLDTRIATIEKELARLKESLFQEKAKRDNERKLLVQAKDIKADIAKLEHDAMIAEKDTDYNKVAEIRYGKIPNLQTVLANIEKRIEEKRAAGSLLVRDMVTVEDIAGVIAKWTGIPATKLIEKDVDKLTNLETWLSEHVIGQRDAVSVVSRAIRRSRAGLQDPNRPIGSFIFAGPTGVGKTELAKSLAEYLFNDRHAMIRIDMSEYMEKHAVARLIGAPPGYVGYDEGGQLTDAIRRKPYSVILFDEIEKAHPDVFNVLLQILDDGRLTDSKGRTVNFKNAIIIMTTNLGSENIMEALSDVSQEDAVRKTTTTSRKSAAGKSAEQSTEKNTTTYAQKKAALYTDLMQVFRGFFRPEFLNRVDDIVLFDPITQATLRHIVDVQLATYIQMIQKEKDIALTITDAAKDELGAVGFDPAFGARPLKRAVQRYLLDPLALQIIEGKAPEGSKVVADYVDGEFVFHLGR